MIRLHRRRSEPSPEQPCWQWTHITIDRVAHLAWEHDPATLCGLDATEVAGGECRRGKHCGTCREAAAR